MLIETDMAPFQALAVLFVLVVIAVTSIQAGRLAWSMRRASRAPGLTPDVSADRVFAQATLIARSTQGLARTSVWLMCAASAVSMHDALIVLGSQYPMLTQVRQHLDVLSDAAIGLGLCALLFAAAIAFDLVAVRASLNSPLAPSPQALEKDAGPTRRMTLRHDVHLALGLIALVLFSGVLANLGPMDIAIHGQDKFLISNTIELLKQIWIRIAIVLAIIGVLNWLTTLLQSAMLRRRLSLSGRRPQPSE